MSFFRTCFGFGVAPSLSFSRNDGFPTMTVFSPVTVKTIKTFDPVTPADADNNIDSHNTATFKTLNVVNSKGEARRDARLFMRQVIDVLNLERGLAARGVSFEAWPWPSVCAGLSASQLVAIDFLRVQLRVNPDYVLGGDRW